MLDALMLLVFAHALFWLDNLGEKGMKDYYKNTRECIDDYNRIIDEICNSPRDTTDEEDERL